MTEGTKALNSAVSTLKKNPGRIGRLVKAAQFLIVPPKQYSKGKARELAEAAVAKLKAKRGLNGVVGEGAGSFSDKALQKKAEDKKGAGYAATVGATGAAAGWAMGRDIQKHKNIMRSSGRNIIQMNKGVPLSKVYGRADTFDRRAARTVKGAGRRGALIGAVTGAVAGLGARKVEKAMEKKAVDKKTQDRALAASAVGSGAALGGVLTHDAKKSRVTSRMGTKGAYKHMADPSVEGAEKRLANSAKTLRRMGKPLRRAGIKGAIVGGLAGAALGAAHLKKEAAMPAVTPKQEFLGKGAIPAGAKDVSPKAVLKYKAGKVGKIALGVAGGVALASAAKKHMEKKAEKKDSNVAGAAIGAGSVAYTARSAADSVKGIKGVHKQYTYLMGKGRRPGPIDVHMAMKTLEKPIARRAARASVKAGVAGALAGAAYDHFRGHKKSAAEKIIHDGEVIRKGTVTSSATKTGTLAGVLTAIGHRKDPKNLLKSVSKSMLSAGTLGGTYGVARKALRTARGEKSMDPREFDKKKSLQKQAAEMIERNGQKYRKGTTTSAATKMAVGYGATQALGNVAAKRIATKLGAPIVTNTLGHKVPQYAAMGAGLGFLYGKVRAHRRNNRGEVSLSPAEFKKMKAS